MLFEETYTKFFNIPGETETTGDYLAFHHTLIDHVGQDVTFHTKFDRSRVVTVQNSKQAQAMTKLLDNDGTRIPVYKNQILNPCTGTVAIQRGVLLERIFQSKETEESIKRLLEK